MKHITHTQIILASQSPRRKYLLEQAGITFSVIPSHVDEMQQTGETPRQYVERLSRDKALDVARHHENAWIIGADTIVVVDDTLLEKPTSMDHARKMLQQLSNRTHTVFTGFTVCGPNESAIITRHVTTQVEFKSLSPAEIEWYISTQEPFDKAGAYAIQGLGTFLVKGIHGSYTNVVGLPVCEVIEVLIQENVIRSFNH
ncbi:Maf family protein [Desulfocicer vacuolatum]|nr:Maf family protein [Desulfocicer vacuolatum]